MKHSQRQLPPLSVPLFPLKPPCPLSRARVCLLNISAVSSCPLISSIINVLATHHRAICDRLWPVLSVAPSKFTAASSGDECWGQTQGCGGGMGTQAALPLSCLSAKRGCRGPRATGSVLGRATAAGPAWSGLCSRGWRLPGPRSPDSWELKQILGLALL